MNNETKPKRLYTEAQIRAVKAFHERHRESKEYKLNEEKILYERKGFLYSI